MVTPGRRPEPPPTTPLRLRAPGRRLPQLPPWSPGHRPARPVPRSDEIERPPRGWRSARPGRGRFGPVGSPHEGEDSVGSVPEGGTHLVPTRPRGRNPDPSRRAGARAPRSPPIRGGHGDGPPGPYPRPAARRSPVGAEASTPGRGHAPPPRKRTRPQPARPHLPRLPAEPAQEKPDIPRRETLRTPHTQGTRPRQTPPASAHASRPPRQFHLRPARTSTKPGRRAAAEARGGERAGPHAAPPNRSESAPSKVPPFASSST
jgi:hypothetical protein